MRVVTNESLIKQNRRIATWLFLFSLAVLFGGFFIANASLLGVESPEELDTTIYSVFMPIILGVGFTSTLISVRMTNLWVRLPRPEVAIQNGIKGLSNKSALYNYFHFPARHVLVCPQGVFAIITRFQDGRFTVDGDKWKTHKGLISQLFTFFRLDGIGNPTRDALEAAAYIQYICEDYDPEIKVQPLIIFVDPRAQININNSTVPVLYADLKKEPNLKSYFRDAGKSPVLSKPDELAAFIAEFEDATLGEDA